MKALGYIRVSTQGQEEKYGIETQRDEIIKRCKESGYELVDIVIDVISGIKEERPNFDKILAGEYVGIDKLVIFKTDRVAREIRLFYYFEMLLNKLNMTIESIIDDFSDFGDYANIIKSFTLFVAEMERKNITLRTSGGRKTKAKTGKYAGGKAPYGYKVVGGLLVIDEEESKILSIMIELKEQKQYNYSQIEKYLNENGYKTRNGGEWQRITVMRILNHNKEFYKGNYQYSDCGMVKGFHEAII